MTREEYEPSAALPPVTAVVNRRTFLPQLAANRHVVHLGCVDERLTSARAGTGALLHEELSSVATSLLGVDISADGLALMASVVPGDYLAGDVESLSHLELPAACDIVLAPEIIEHLAAPGRFLSELRVYLERSGAVAYVTTPNCYSWSHVLRFALRRREWVHPDHRAIYSPVTLVRALDLAGLEARKLYAHAWRPRSGLTGRVVDVIDGALLRWNPWLAVGLIAEVVPKPQP